MDVEQAPVDVEWVTTASVMDLEVIEQGLSLCASERAVMACIAK